MSPFAIATLAAFYEVSTDYLLGLTENKKHPGTEVSSLHLSDEVLTILRSGKLNNRLIGEVICHASFPRLLTDMDIIVDGIADRRIQDLNRSLESSRQEVLARYSPDENDLHMRTLEVAQIKDTQYFSYLVQQDMDTLLGDIRIAHKSDTTTADAIDENEQIKADLVKVMNSDNKALAFVPVFCNQLHIPYKKLCTEEIETIARVVRMSSLYGTGVNRRGKKRR